MLNFKEFEILAADREKRDNLRHRTKFYVDRSKCYRDIAIFRLSRWWPSASLIMAALWNRAGHYILSCGFFFFLLLFFLA